MIAWGEPGREHLSHTHGQESPKASPVLVLDVAGNTVRPKYLNYVVCFIHFTLLARYAHLLTSTSFKVGRDTTLPVLFNEPTGILTPLQKAILVSNPVLIGPRPPLRGSDPLSPSFSLTST